MKNFLSLEYRQILLDALEKKIGRKTMYIDMDGVVADFDGIAIKWAAECGMTAQEFKDKHMYRQPNFFLEMDLMPGAKEAIESLDSIYEIVFLSAPSWRNPHSFTEKRLWIEKHFGEWGKKRLDLSYRKGLYMGHYLIDDRTKYGASEFIGEHIMFGTEPFNTWTETENYLMSGDYLLK